MASALVTVSNELAAIVEAAAPHVVSISARRHHPASGVLWKPDVVLTAEHAIRRDEDISVSLAGGSTVSARLAGRDPGSDLAVLRLQAAVASKGEFAAATAVTPGELALVLGRSPNSGINASLGIISAVSGEWRTWRGGRLDSYIRVDAKMFPNSAGGAVVNSRGQLVGIATPALSRVAGLAIPMATAARTAESLLERGWVPRGYLGIGIQVVALPDPLREKLSLAGASGLMVLSVEANGPADKAGVLIGDILTSIADNSIERPEDLQQFSDSGVIGQSATAKFVRGGKIQELSLVVAERPRRDS
jgi:S1-C subfamily serine protease